VNMAAGPADADGNVALDAAIQASSGLHLQGPHASPEWLDEPAGALNPPNMPMVPAGPRTTVVKHFVDVVADISPPDKAAIQALCDAGKWDELPAPFCMKDPLQLKYVMQFAVVPDRTASQPTGLNPFGL
jgi:hypothetical protein